MKRKLIYLVCLVMICITFIVPAFADDNIPLLFMTQSEKQVEIKIKEYIDKISNLKFDFNVMNEKKQDYLITKMFSYENKTPKIKIIVDTHPIVSEKDKKIVARRIMILGIPIIPNVISERDRIKYIKYCNESNMRRWSPGKVFLDKEGSLLLVTNITIAGEDSPVHAEQVHHSIMSMVLSWPEIAGEMKSKELISY